MSLSNLFSKAKELAGNEKVRETAKKIASSDKVKSAVKNVANNKNVKSTISKATKTVEKVAKATGINMNDILSLVTKNKTVTTALINLGLKKESDPASSAVQKLVGTLKSSISKASGIKVEDKTFSSVVTKLLSNSTIKSQVEKTAGSGVTSFIKKAVAEYIS